jgi:cell division protein ZipA
MDADILRLILFLAGIGLILGIYLWDRRKRAAARSNAVQRARREREPGLGDEWEDPAEEDESFEPEEDATGAAPAVREAPSRSRPDPLFAEPAAELDGPVVGEQAAFSFAAEERDDWMSDEGIPHKILQLNLVARKARFSGDAIMQATRDTDLVHGPMAIFHRYTTDRQSRILFSMANLVEPGNFDLEKMADFSTPGLTLFAQLPGPLEGVRLFDEMLATAQRLAALLDAEIQDESHSDMSRQTIEHLREELVEFERKVRLARKKR